VLVDADNLLIAGHGRLEAAKALGLAEIPAIVLEGLSDAQKQALRVADNKLALNAGWDDDLLRTELMDLRDVGFDLSVIGFGDDELASIFADANAGLTDPDDVPEAPLEPVTQLGDVWLLGRHRLVCGDATSEVDVSLALAGVRPHLMVTDPPYGVSLDPTWRDRSGANTLAKAESGSRHYLGGGSLDTEARWDAVWQLSPADVFYVFCAAGPLLIEAAKGLEDCGFELRQILVWDKGVLTLTRTHYWYTHEHILYGVRKGKTAHWVGANGQPSVWSVPSPKHIMSGSKEKREPHPAQRPVECMRRPIENNSSPGQAVYDPFVGSGTTIIAAEMTGRACHAIEISPAYCDVAVLRWQAFTGQTATRPDGTPFGAAHVEATPRQATVSAD
jgi:DNA modification methylase